MRCCRVDDAGSTNVPSAAPASPPFCLSLLYELSDSNVPSVTEVLFAVRILSQSYLIIAPHHGLNSAPTCPGDPWYAAPCRGALHCCRTVALRAPALRRDRPPLVPRRRLTRGASSTRRRFPCLKRRPRGQRGRYVSPRHTPHSPPSSVQYLEDSAPKGELQPSHAHAA
jgi:hypothetical protein